MATSTSRTPTQTNSLTTSPEGTAIVIRIIIARIIRHAFMAGYEAALNNATQEMDGSEAFPSYEPYPTDWQQLDDQLSALQQ